MSTANNPFPYFSEAATNGFIYIGAANQDAQANPITVYRDAALTTPWEQPIRTLNGYPAYLGATAGIYINATAFSVTVKDNNGLTKASTQNTPTIADFASLALTTTAALLGANDASSGAKYTTVQGFITYLLSSVGSGIVGFIQSGTGAVLRTLLSKGRDTVSPEDFGAVGDGTTNDYAALLAAMQSGRVVDGNGRTYALGSALTPSSFKGLRNCNFKWANTTVMATQVYLLNIIDKSNFFIDNCTFDLGTVENTGDDDDSSRGGLRITTSNEFVTFNDHVRVTNCRAFGKGNGTGIYIRSCRWVHVAHNTVHDRVVAFSPDPSNDCQNGFDISKCYNATIVGNISRDQQTRLSGSLAKRYSRGFAFIELIDSAVIGCTVADVDQGFDFSGAITATLVNGNNNVAVSGCAASDCNTYGFKFANCSHDITVSGCVAKRFGFVGFVFSGPTSTPLDATKNTQRILLTGCHAFDPTGSFSASCYGFRLMQAGTSVGYPRGIRMVGCTVSDVTGGGKLYQGFNSDVTYDSSGNFNELIECRSIGHTDVASSGFTYTVAQLPAGHSLMTEAPEGVLQALKDFLKP